MQITATPHLKETLNAHQFMVMHLSAYASYAKGEDKVKIEKRISIHQELMEAAERDIKLNNEKEQN